GTLHTSCGDFQSPHPVRHGWQSYLSLSWPKGRHLSPFDDAGRRRIHSMFLASCAARRVSTRPSLRLARQSLEENPTRTLLSTSPCRAHSIRTCPSGSTTTHHLSGLPLGFDVAVRYSPGKSNFPRRISLLRRSIWLLLRRQ